MSETTSETPFELQPPEARERPAGAVSPNEFAKLVGYTAQMVLKWMHQYGLPHTKLGGRYWIDREQGQAWFANRRKSVMDPAAGGRRRRGRPSISESSATARWRTDAAAEGGGGGGLGGGLPIIEQAAASTRAAGGVGGGGGGGGYVGGGGGDEGPNGELYRAKVAKELAAAKKLELENAVSMAKLVAVEDAEAAWTGVLSSFRAGLDALPERAVNDIMVEVEAWLTTGAVDDREELRERLNEKLVALADEVRRTLREGVSGSAGAGGETRSAA